MAQGTVNTEELQKFSQLSHEWWNEHGPLSTLHDINPTRVDFIQSYTPLKQKRVLDVGCGGGILCESLAKLGAEVTGIDAEASAIKVAEQHREALAIHYQCTPIEQFEARAFDIVTCMEMLEHVDNPTEVITNTKRLLAPGASLFLSTINRSLEAYLKAIIGAEYLLHLLPKQTHDYQKFIKPSELSTVCRRAGLQVVGLKGIHYNPFTRKASLTTHVGVNYLLACKNPIVSRN